MDAYHDHIVAARLPCWRPRPLFRASLVLIVTICLLLLSLWCVALLLLRWLPVVVVVRRGCVLVKSVRG